MGNAGSLKQIGKRQSFLGNVDIEIFLILFSNRLPGLESSNNNKDEEDNMYDTMMLELLTIVLANMSPAKVYLNQCWEMVDGGSMHGPVYSESSLPMNILKWKMHTRSLRSKLLINNS